MLLVSATCLWCVTVFPASWCHDWCCADCTSLRRPWEKSENPAVSSCVLNQSIASRDGCLQSTLTCLPLIPQPEPGRLRTPVSDLQQSNGLPEAGPEAGLEEAEGEPGRASMPEPVRFGWVKGVMVSVTDPTWSILLPSHPLSISPLLHFSQYLYFFQAPVL